MNAENSSLQNHDFSLSGVQRGKVQDPGSIPYSRSGEPPDPRLGVRDATISEEIPLQNFIGTFREQNLTETRIVNDVARALKNYDGGGTPEQQDALFATHTAYIKQILQGGDLRPAIDLWDKQLLPLITEREQQLGKTIHKGAPLYNTGVACFVAGDLDTALSFLSNAGEADENLARGSQFNVALGHHHLSREIMIIPLENLLKRWAADYLRASAHPLNLDELKSLLSFLKGRPADAIQMLTALHRILRTTVRTQDHATRLIRFRAIGDLLLLVESFLRQFQAVSKQLDAHLHHLFRTNPVAEDARCSFGKDFESWRMTKGCRKDSPEAMNWITEQMRPKLDSAKTPAEAAGYVAYFCHRFRNSLLHVNEENLDIFQDKEMALVATGWVLTMLRICARGKQGTITSASFA